MNHQPRKRFGQNFLRDVSIIHRIASAIDPQAGDHLVEIGPGEGVLTETLLPRCRRLDAVEIDRDLVALLERRFAGRPAFHLHRADALRFDFRALREAGDGMGNIEKLRIVGNLPYNISTPLLFHLFGQADAVADMYFMLQKEVVERLCAQAGDSEYGRLGIMAGYFCSAEMLFEVSPDSFHPRPKVVSAVVRLLPHASPPVDADPAALGKVVATAFSQRRKTLRNALKTLFDEAELRDCGIDPAARAETLCLEAYAALARRWMEKHA